MKITLVTCLSAALLACGALAQTPTAPPALEAAPPSPAAAAPAPAAPAVPSPPPAATATPADRDDLESRITRGAKKHGLSITFGDDDEKGDRKDRKRDRDHIRIDKSDFDEGALMAIPIIGIIFTTLFGAPVLIVATIMFFSYWKARSLHRTVRLMVEKGQPVPDSLFATPHSPAKQRSDMRRGVVLVMVGIGVMVFFGAVSDWDGGAWALGIIPFLIGAGYLVVWKLEGPKPSTDNPPSLT